MKTGILIVNYKTPWHLNECLKSIVKHTKNFHIILVQNDPDIESLKISSKFEKILKDNISVLINKENIGLVGGVNSGYDIGIKFDRLCFLNSDVIVTKNWLKYLNEVFDRSPNVVQVSPDLNQYYKENLFWRVVKFSISKKFPKTGARVYRFLLNLNPPKNPSGQTDFQKSTLFYQFCTGACNLVRTKFFKNRGYFWDPNIIHGYGDDFDTTYYLRQFGDVGVTNKSYVFHFVNTSFNNLNPQKKNLKEKLQKLNQYYVINKWEERITRELKNFDSEQILDLSYKSDLIKLILEYWGLKKHRPDFSSWIKTIPAKKIWRELNNY